MFDYYQPTRIHFGSGRLRELGKITAKYGKKALLVTTPDEPLRPLYERVKKILSDDKDKLDELAKYLYEKETITGKEFMDILLKDEDEER